MSHPMPHHRTRTRRARLSAVAAAALLALIAPLAGLNAAVAAPSLPKPTSITVTAQTDPALATQLVGTPSQAMPGVLTAVGQTFQITVSLWAGQQPAAFPNATTVALTPSGPGALTLVGAASAVIAKNQSSATFTVSYSAPSTALTVTGTISSGGTRLNGQTASFPVELNLNVIGGTDPALGNGTAGADGTGCTTVDAAHPMCGIVTLPRGATGNVALSLGLCPAGATCTTGALATQLIANLTGTDGVGLYTRTSPAQMTIVCDKSICGQGGVPSYHALWSQTAAGPFVTAPACPAKGVIGADQTFCTDTVQSTRDNAGDLLLVVLFLTDLKGMI